MIGRAETGADVSHSLSHKKPSQSLLRNIPNTRTTKPMNGMHFQPGGLGDDKEDIIFEDNVKRRVRYNKGNRPRANTQSPALLRRHCTDICSGERGRCISLLFDFLGCQGRQLRVIDTVKCTASLRRGGTEDVHHVRDVLTFRTGWAFATASALAEDFRRATTWQQKQAHLRGR